MNLIIKYNVVCKSLDKSLKFSYVLGWFEYLVSVEVKVKSKG